MPGPGYSTEDPNQQIARPGGGRPHAILVLLCRVKADRPRADHGWNIETKPEYRVYLFPTTVPAAVWLFCRGPKHTTDDTTTTTTRDKKNAPCAIARPIPRVECVASGHGGAVVFVSRARSFVWCVTPRGAGAFKSQAAAAAWWDVAWYVGRTKRHGVGF